MIPKETIDRIFEEARIDEVVGDFVSLKKRGANLLGCCPFHNEKTPSFTVSPVKGIYKCFGCGAAGNSVNFIMQHESMSYPEALRFLAKKYGIEIEERELSDKQKEAFDKREQLFLITQLANEHFVENLKQNEEGKRIGYSYLKEREISDEMIEKFELGFALADKKTFCSIAKEKGYKEEVLAAAGLSIQKEGRPPIDRFFDRVIFPIHNISGRVLGFGARTLSTEKKVAKYLNSPETEIYHKSKVLYGLFQSKRSIIQQDNCFLVEGYTDVISLHQKGIENVVASSGTSLTEDQIKLIRRFTKNITVLFDGDAAGIKASFRGIDMLLKEDMQVKVVRFPEGEDPDSFAKAHSTFEIENHLKDGAEDFIAFKIGVLLEGAGNDPIKRANLIKDVVQSISLIGDNIIRSVYIQQASTMLGMEEKVLSNEVIKIRRQGQGRSANFAPQDEVPPPEYVDIPPEFDVDVPSEQKEDERPINLGLSEERDLIRLLLNYGHIELTFPIPKDANTDSISEFGEEVQDGDSDSADSRANDEENLPTITVAEYIIMDLNNDEISFVDPLLSKVFTVFNERLEEGEIPTEKYFLQSDDQELVQQVIELVNQKYLLSENWKKHQIFVVEELDQLKLAIAIACNRLKMARIKEQIKSLQNQIQSGDSANEDELFIQLNNLMAIKGVISKELGRV